MKKIIVLITLLLLLIPLKSYSLDDLKLNSDNLNAEHPYYEYWTYSGDKVTFEWTDTNEVVTHFNVKIKKIETGQEFVFERVNNSNLEIVIPKTGHFVFQVQSCNDNLNSENKCSEWSESTDSTKAIVNGENKAWVVYGLLKPPGPIVIE